MDSRQVSDEVEIAALLNAYARAVDTKDWELYRSVFTDDAHIDYSAASLHGITRRGDRFLRRGLLGVGDDEHALHHQHRVRDRR